MKKTIKKAPKKAPKKEAPKKAPKNLAIIKGDLLVNGKVLKGVNAINLKKKDFQSFIYSIIGIDRDVNNSSCITCMDNLEIWRPNYKDLNLKTHKHYNPKALINVMCTIKVLKEYDLSKDFKVINTSEKGDLWNTNIIQFEKVEDFKRFVKHMKSKGYEF